MDVRRWLILFLAVVAVLVLDRTASARILFTPAPELRPSAFSVSRLVVTQQAGDEPIAVEVQSGFFCAGDPVNGLDPDGRCGIETGNSFIGPVQSGAGASIAVAGATFQTTPTIEGPYLNSPSTSGGPSAPPEPGTPDVPNLGPATVAAGTVVVATGASVTWALTSSIVAGNRESNIVNYGNPYGPSYYQLHQSSTIPDDSESSDGDSATQVQSSMPPPQPPGPPIVGAAAPNSPNGDNEYNATGREAHQWWTPPDGFVKEYTFTNGLRADAVNFETGEILELKPNNPAAIARGNAQLQQYIQQAQTEFPKVNWTGRVVTY